MSHGASATVELIAKADGIIAGLDVFARTFELDSQSSVLFDVADGDEVHAGDHVGQVRGDARVLLSGERVALNYLQRMSGIATYTHQMAVALEGTKTVLVDTRKTTPGMRVFEKAAVEIGGGSNHRYNLSTAVMLKDNHIDAAGGVTRAIEMARAHASFTTTVEIECENTIWREAVEAGARHIAPFDNATHDDMVAAIELIAGRAKTARAMWTPTTFTHTLIWASTALSGALTHPRDPRPLMRLRLLDGNNEPASAVPSWPCREPKRPVWAARTREVVSRRSWCRTSPCCADGHDIVATNQLRARRPQQPRCATRLVKVRHGVEQAGDEHGIVDAGGAMPT
ncbi:MAG: carboxylating nicotinate-nucleotide diphosphorylase [Collinsella aerofaciens]